MDKWRLRQFKTAHGRDIISDWRKSLSPARRAVMNTFLKRVVKMQSWPTGICDPLKGSSKGNWELRWTAEKVEHRIFGYYEGDSFVMMVGCTHKGKVYDPPGAFNMLRDRLTKLRQGEGAVNDFVI